MANHSLSSLSRRGLLQLGMLAGLFGTVGCGEEGAVEKVDSPPAAGGNRNRLKKLEEKKAELPEPKKK